MSKRPFTAKTVAVPDCQVGEDVVFSADNKRFFLTCMGSSKLIIGDAVADRPTQTVSLSQPYPHGGAIHDGIDRVLVTSTVRATDLEDAGEHITAIEASTGKVLSSYKVSSKPSPSGEAPVEVLFVPGANPPVAYVTNMFGARSGRRPGTFKRRISTSLRRSISPRLRPAFPWRSILTARPIGSTSRQPSPDTCTFSISARTPPSPNY